MLRPSKDEDSSSSGKTWMFFVLCIIGLTNFFKFIGNDHTASSSYTADPAYQARMAAQLRERTERAARELEAAAPSPSTLTASDLAQANGLSAGPRDKPHCREGAQLAERLKVGVAKPDPLDRNFDAFIVECVRLKLWPTTGDPASVAALDNAPPPAGRLQLITPSGAQTRPVAQDFPATPSLGGDIPTLTLPEDSSGPLLGNKKPTFQGF